MADEQDRNDEQGAAPVPPASAAAPEPSPPPAAPPPAGGGGFDLGTVIGQAKQVITDPVGFYRGMPKSGGYSEPLIFALVMGALAGAVFGVLSIIGLTGMGAAGLGAIIMMPIALLIGGFIGAAVLFVIWKLMGSPENYETAYRCVAYSYAITPVLAVFSIIPYVGTIVRTVWGIWLMFTASIEVHGRSRQTALIVFGILGVLVLLTGLSGERAQRALEEKLEERSAAMEQSMQSLKKLGVDEEGNIDPEKAGRALGDFMRSMQEAAEGTEQQAE